MHKINIRKLNPETSHYDLKVNDHVPGVLNGQGTKMLKIHSSERELKRALKHKSKVYRVQSNYFSTPAKLVDVRKNPYTNKLTYFCLERVPENSIEVMEVPVELTGIPIGVKHGGMLARVSFCVKVKGDPQYIPDAIHEDASHLDIGDVFTAKDIKKTNGKYHIIDGESTIIARCEIPSRSLTPLLETDFTRDFPRGNLKHNTPYTSLAV